MKDTIYREDAIKAIHNYWKKRLDTLPTKESEYGEVYADIQQMDKILEHNKALCNFIKAIPSADRPQGEWIDAEIPLESGGSMPIQACNLCKTFYPLAYTGGGHRFCPNCGARMKGADDYERAIEQSEHDMLYEPTYNSEDGSM